MFATNKMVFAGKARLQAEPFCPFISNEQGFLSLKRQKSHFLFRPNQPHVVRPSVSGGKHR